MEEKEKVDLIKAITSIKTPVYWVKTLMYMLGFCFILTVGFAFWKAFFKKPPPTQSISMQSGSQLTIKNEAAKRGFILFAEPYVAVDSADKGSIGIRSGCRFEF